MLDLVVLSPAFGMRNVSPYCVKAEMLLKSLDLPFKLVEEADPRKAPKGKLPKDLPSPACVKTICTG
jgi:hypothetical protein